MHIMNIYGDNGSPFLMPLVGKSILLVDRLPK